MKIIVWIRRPQLSSLVLLLYIGYGLAVMSPAVGFMRVKDGGDGLSTGMAGIARVTTSLLDNYCADLKTHNSLLYQKNCFTGEDEETPHQTENRQRKPSHEKQGYIRRHQYYWPMYPMTPACYYVYTWWYPRLVCHHAHHAFYG